MSKDLRITNNCTFRFWNRWKTCFNFKNSQHPLTNAADGESQTLTCLCLSQTVKPSRPLPHPKPALVTQAC